MSNRDNQDYSYVEATRLDEVDLSTPPAKSPPITDGMLSLFFMLAQRSARREN